MAFMMIRLTGSAQSTITGTVYEGDTGEPLVGATILEFGTTNGTVSDIQGKFQLTLGKSDADVVVSSIGFMTQTVSVGGRSVVDITLEVDVKSLEEVVVTGYGVQKKKEVTGAIASIKAEEINKVATSDFAAAIQGQMAGVSVRNGSGAPGENAQITIRGITSFQEGGSSPLFVVDGVTFTSNPNITPQEIESIEVLKDGASAAIYGSRASAGVILITTKKGKEGQMKVSLDAYYGFQNITSGIPLANTAEGLYISDIQNRYQATNQFYPLSSNPDALLYDTDWLGELQNDNAPIQNYTLSVSGGKDGLTYNVVGTYFGQEGSLILSNYDKYSLRSNTGFKKGRFSAQTNLGVNISNQKKEPWALMFDAIKNAPYRQPLNPDDDAFSLGGTNPEVLTGFTGKLKQENSTDQRGLNGNLQLAVEVVDGLTAKANLGGSFNNSKDRSFNPSYSVYNEQGELNVSATNNNATLRLTDGTSTRTIAEFTLNYNKQFGDHNISALAGRIFETSRWDWYRTGADFITSNSTPTLGNGQPIVGQHTISETTISSYLGRLLYNYKSKYMLSAVVRRDGSSNFGPNNRYGVFPSVSAAWTLSEEGFFQNEFVTFAKVRAGYGSTGSDRIPAYAYVPVVISNADYPFGNSGSLTQGLTQPGFADPNLKWETNISKNLGVDLEFLSGKVGITADLYEQDKEDMLLSIVSPISAGSTPVSGKDYDKLLTNIGNLRNRGVELQAHYNQSIGDFNFKLSGTFTKNKNEVISLSREDEIIYGGYPHITRQGQTEPVAALKEGLPVGAFLVYETDGTIKNGEELAEYQEMFPSAQLGDLKYVDTNGDSTITIDDRVYKGSAQPDFEYGFNIDASYKNFDLSIQFYGIQGSTVYNGPKMYAYSTHRHKDLVYAWTDANPTSEIPTPRTSIEHPNVRTSTDYFLEDGSFLRMRNVIIGYTLPGEIVSKAGISRARIYLSAQNPITWTGYTGYDPEVGSNNPFNAGLDTGKYPVSAVYRTGITIDF